MIDRTNGLSRREAHKYLDEFLKRGCTFLECAMIMQALCEVGYLPKDKVALDCLVAHMRILKNG